MDSEKITSEANALRERAARSRKYAWLSAVLIVTVVFSIVTFFSLKGFQINFGPSYVATNYPIMEKGKEYDWSKEEEKIVRLIAQLEDKIASITSDPSSSELTVSVISIAVVRVGTVLIALYLVQILYSIMRYHFRVADYLESSATVLELSQGDNELLVSMNSVMNMNHIEFGKQPNAPMEQVIELLKQVKK